VRRILPILFLAACGDDSSSGGIDAATIDAAHGSDAAHDTAPIADAPPDVAGILFVNEVMPSNATACADEFGEFDDWAELYNAGSTAIDLTGFSVTDDETNPTKVVLSGVTVPAHGYTLIWCDGQVQGPNHVSFKLSASGEQFAVYSPGGVLVDELTFGAATTDHSFARLPDGTGAFADCATSTCGATNGTSCATP
jgi:hypothetical protein